MLWLALYFPDFALQTSAPVSDGIPFCVHESVHGRAQIIACNAAAAAGGIETGMTLTAAQSLLGSLQSIERDPERETQALRQLAIWAQQFTPVVSLRPPHGLLLEIGASLSLFEGIDNLKARLLQALQTLGHHAQTGIAPTPAAAWLLATAALDNIITNQQALPRSIGPLPIQLLELDSRMVDALHSSGIRRIDALLQLPRDALSQRFGTALPTQLDRLLGKQPDPQTIFQLPPRFHAQLMLADAVHDTAPLLFMLRRLLHQLAGFLRGHNAGVQSMRLGLISPRLPVDTLHLDLLSPGNDPEHLLKLWQEKLDKHRLQAGVEGIELTADKLSPLSADNLDLFLPRSHNQSLFIHFLERLRNRLGKHSIQQLQSIAEHRPARAWRKRQWQPKKPSPPPLLGAKRPPCLLEPPHLLHDHAGTPLLDARPLELLDGPERIESGWWDGHPIRRDYYIAQTAQQQTVWIFQELGKQHQWFLQGYFG